MQIKIKRKKNRKKKGKKINNSDENKINELECTEKKKTGKNYYNIRLLRRAAYRAKNENRISMEKDRGKWIDTGTINTKTISRN